MTKLISVDQVKSALRDSFDDDDAILELYIEAASNAVINYLKDQAEVLLELDTGGDLVSGAVVPPEIATATVILVGHFYREIDGNPEEAFDRGYLPKPVTALLYPLRDPALR